MHRVVMRMLKEHEALCLSVHDSLITKGKYSAVAQRILAEEYKKAVAIIPILKQKATMSCDKKGLVKNNFYFQSRKKAFELQS